MGESNVVSESTYYQTPTYSAGASSKNLNIKNIGEGNSQVFMPSTGEAKILVIPIQFSDYSFPSGYGTMLENAFFGDEDDTSWQSVSSYYYESSNCKLTITGEISPVYSVGMSSAAAERQADSDGNTAVSDSILHSALKYLVDSDYDLTRFDGDGDGYIDAVWMVYSAPYDTNSDLLWAYTYWDYEEGARVKTKYDGMYTSSYSWASYDFLTRYTSSLSSGYNADCHTMIHETGHLLGLDDYYSYDSGHDAPVGCLDMMDYNVGDHMEFSKYLMGWVAPVVLTEDYLTDHDYTVTINSSDYASNTCYILPIQSEGEDEDFNYTPYDEYLVIEYYTPSGLDYNDAKTAYENRTRMYTESGVLVYHVNNRIGKLNYSNGDWTWDGCAYDRLLTVDTDAGWGVRYIYYPIYSNTASSSFDPNINDSEDNFYRGRLVSLLPQTGQRATTSYYGRNSFLYQKNDKFMINNGTYDNFLFDDGSMPLFGFKVDSCDTDSTTLTFGYN